MAISGARVAGLVVTPSIRTSSVTVDLGRRRLFIASMAVTWVDPLIDFDRDNAIAADIFTIDGVRTSIRAFGGDHFGPFGSSANVFQGSIFAFGQRISFFLRAFGPDVAAGAEGTVILAD